MTFSKLHKKSKINLTLSIGRKLTFNNVASAIWTRMLRKLKPLKVFKDVNLLSLDGQFSVTLLEKFHIVVILYGGKSSLLGYDILS